MKRRAHWVQLHAYGYELYEDCHDPRGRYLGNVSKRAGQKYVAGHLCGVLTTKSHSKARKFVEDATK